MAVYLLEKLNLSLKYYLQKIIQAQMVNSTNHLRNKTLYKHLEKIAEEEVLPNFLCEASITLILKQDIDFMRKEVCTKIFHMQKF